jgi:predicted ArsR family transcriptional regulator
VTATELAASRSVTRQAIVKHLQQLAAANLIVAEKVGREQRYTVRAGGTEDAVGWMAAVGSAWDARLAKLAERHPGTAPGGARR